MTGPEFAKIRAELGLSQAELARIIGGKNSRISDYETGRQKITDKLALLMVFVQEAHKRGADINAVAARACR